MPGNFFKVKRIKEREGNGKMRSTREKRRKEKIIAAKQLSPERAAQRPIHTASFTHVLMTSRIRSDAGKFADG